MTPHQPAAATETTARHSGAAVTRVIHRRLFMVGMSPVLAFLALACWVWLSLASAERALSDSIREKTSLAVLAKDLIAAYLDAKFSTAEEFRRRVAKLADMDAGR